MNVSGVPKVVLKPNLVSIASYPELSPPFESVIGRSLSVTHR